MKSWKFKFAQPVTGQNCRKLQRTEIDRDTSLKVWGGQKKLHGVAP